MPDDPDSALAAAIDAALRAAALGPQDGLIVAVSGGLDSMVLLHALHERTRHDGPRLHVAHLDHGLRRASAADAAHVRAVAERLGWPVTVAAEDVGQRARREGLSPEQAGRAARRALFERVRQASGLRWVATGHHADDQAETLLLRLLRGAGPTGLAGIRPLTGEGYLRPLLGLRRAELEGWARSRDLEVREDDSNSDPAIPRNRVRHQLLPALAAAHNPAVVEALGRTARLLQAEDDYLAAAADEARAAVAAPPDGRSLLLDAPRLRRYHIAIRRRVLHRCIQEVGPQRRAPVPARDVDAAEALLEGAAVGRRQLTGDVLVEVTARRLILRHGPPVTVCTRLRVPGDTELPGRALRMRARLEPARGLADLHPRLDAWHVAFDAAVLDAELWIRTPRPGDRLQPLGMGDRHKKLSDCFIDAGWPRSLRPEALLLTRRSGAGSAEGDEEILWVAGLIRSNAHRVQPGTRRILFLEVVDAPASAGDS